MTIRIAQTELGQGVWTSNAMMVCEELQCDWSKVRPQYASANRDAREKAPDVDVEGPGQRRRRSHRRRRADVRQSRSHRRRGHSRQPLPADADERGLVGEGRPLLSAACRRRSARAAAAGRRGAVERARDRADREEQRHHARAERPDDDVRTDRAACRRDAASQARVDHDQAAGPVDADGHRAEEPRRAAQGHRPGGLRDRRAPARHEVGGREDLPGLRRRRQALRLRARSAECRACVPPSSSRSPIRR